VLKGTNDNQPLPLKGSGGERQYIINEEPIEVQAGVTAAGLPDS
jgi:hypothetical protein